MSTSVQGYRSYREYLAGDRWREIRAAAIARAGGRCALCGEERPALEVRQRYCQ